VIPLRNGSPQQFAGLRDILGRAEYVESKLCARLGINSLVDYQPSERMPPTDTLDVLERLFMNCDSLPAEVVRPLLSDVGCELLADLGLITQDADGLWSGTVLLYPANSFWIVSDRWLRHDSAEDVVYPAITAATQHFLAGLPETPCDALLDLCSGTGIAGLMAASRYARHAWAFDITERSTRFAEFNQALNSVPNFTAAQGDLFEPAGDQTFDRIVVHPPYVPVTGNVLIYRDAGQDGEQVLRRVIEDAPRYLRPGGRLYCQAMGSDRLGATFDVRVRQWLGDRSAEFDVLLAAHEVSSPAEMLTGMVRRGRTAFERLQALDRLYRDLQVTSLFQGFVVLQRLAEPRPVFTARKMVKPENRRAVLAWILELESALASPAGIRRLLESPLHVSPNLRIGTEYEIVSGELRARSFSLNLAEPVAARCQGEPWMGSLATAADGRRTGRELMEHLREQGAIAPEIKEDQFAVALKTLVLAGMIEVGGLTPPRAAE
jgi:carbamoyltransferase